MTFLVGDFLRKSRPVLRTRTPRPSAFGGPCAEYRTRLLEKVAYLNTCQHVNVVTCRSIAHFFPIAIPRFFGGAILQSGDFVALHPPALFPCLRYGLCVCAAVSSTISQSSSGTFRGRRTVSSSLYPSAESEYAVFSSFSNF